uniref:Uncharacterized protein n=1 Tax=Piliocolobus tephrosceles TaxID=591936 RepID=A0A8C9GX01_9PRIM
MVMALGPSPTWLPEDRQVGLPTGELRIGEHHDAVLGGFVETKHSGGGTLTNGVHPCDHLVPAQAVAGLVVRFPGVDKVGLSVEPVPLGAARIRAGRALLTHLPKGPRLRALALPTETVPALTADLAIFAPACADVCRAVTVVPDVTCMALAFPAVTLTVA